MTNASVPTIDNAVILMAGTGSRLKGNGNSLPKPLVPLLGRPLISHLLESLARAGVKHVYGVVGYEKELVMTRTRSLLPAGLSIHFIENPEWKKQNGISVLAAAGRVGSPFFLTMSDHLFDDSLLGALASGAATDCINVAIDRKLDSIFDLDDAMKVRTKGNRVLAIGKSLVDYNAIDTGLFICGDNLFDYLNQAKKAGDCSLADGVRLAAADGKARAIDIREGWWQDVDTPEMFAVAETELRTRLESRSAAVGARPHA